MTLIDFIKVVDPGTQIVIREKTSPIFLGEAEAVLNDFTCEQLETPIDTIWLSRSLYGAIVLEIE